MSSTAEVRSLRPNHIAEVEWRLRVDLAACYRIFDHLGWTERIYNHITMRLPGPERHFLINPYGLLYGEVTASNLVKIDLEGAIVGPSDWPVNPAGFIIHSAIHAAREDAHCVMHTHTTEGMAVACLREGLSPDNFYGAILDGQVAYHDFEGITVDPDEKSRLVANLGTRNVLILRNHGLLTCGATIPAAFMRLNVVQRACEVQVMAQMTGRPLIQVSAEARARSAAQHRGFDQAADYGVPLFEAMRREADRADPSYRT